MAKFKFTWVLVALNLVLKSLATEDVTDSYNDMILLPSRSAWVEYKSDGAIDACDHLASNVKGAAVEYTFTGTAIKLYIPGAINAGIVNITISDGTTWLYNTNTTWGACIPYFGLTFPRNQYKPLTVRIQAEHVDEEQWMNIEKFIITKLTAAEYDALVAQSGTPISNQSTQSLTSIASVVEVTTVIGIQTTVGTSVATIPVTTVLTSIAGIGGASANQASDANVAPIVGGVLGSLLGLLLLGILVFLWRRRRQQADIQATAQSPITLTPSQGHPSPPTSSTLATMIPSQLQ